MGILNVTEDSFSDGGKYTDADAALTHALKMQEDGADIIDIGAQSTAPGSVKISWEEEIEKLRAVLPELTKRLSVPISVDTYNPETARFALENGAAIINDVSGVFNPEMAKVTAEYECGWIVTHGMDSSFESPLEDMELINAVSAFFDSVCASCKSFGIKAHQLCFDVGIGFGKSREGDFTVLRELKRLTGDRAMLVGASRKRFIAAACGEEIPEKRIYGTVAANTAAIEAGADILRVHDVKECLQGARVADALFRTKKTDSFEGIIKIRDLKIFAYHGVNPEEKQYGQNFFIDLDVYTDFKKASDSDDIDSTISYAKVIKALRSLMTEKSYDLIETVSKVLADGILERFPAANRVHLVLKKPDAPIKAEFSFVATEIDKCR